MRTSRKRGICISVVGAIALSMGAASATTSAKRYAVPVVPDYETEALFTVGDQVPWIEDESRRYQMVGIPTDSGPTATRMWRVQMSGAMTRPHCS